MAVAGEVDSALEAALVSRWRHESDQRPAVASWLALVHLGAEVSIAVGSFAEVARFGREIERWHRLEGLVDGQAASVAAVGDLPVLVVGRGRFELLQLRRVAISARGGSA